MPDSIILVLILAAALGGMALWLDRDARRRERMADARRRHPSRAPASEWPTPRCVCRDYTLDGGLRAIYADGVRHTAASCEAVPAHD